MNDRVEDPPRGRKRNAMPEPIKLPSRPSAPTRAEDDGATPAFTTGEFEAAYAEPLKRTLDLDTWKLGEDLAETYRRLGEEVEAAVHTEREIVAEIRSTVFPLLRNRGGNAPAEAGVYSVTMADLEAVHRNILFNGAVEACDGTVVSHDTLPVTITQIGVCLASYAGQQGTWVHRLYRRDLRSSGRQLVEETLDLLDRRKHRSSVDRTSPRDRLSDLARRGIMGYAERAVLLDKSETIWRMGHGSPTPYELMTGSGFPELARASLELMRRLVFEQKKFVFVPSAPAAREVITIGNALRPLEYAIIDDTAAKLEKIAGGHYRGEHWHGLAQAVTQFAREGGSAILMGVYRASALAPCQMFYAHRDHVHEAALIALADSTLQEHRGFPMLIDLADQVCSTSFGADTFAQSTEQAYAHAGEPFRFAAERRTRK